ncbi:hypothetical protein FOC1_g10013887 [Fusarium oxysporum f. sp. cubense race 1]|uniref:Uncharacterized protein n=1 Tax=Fusarium oxysporum f. sp. cubense (strain race 1) TaxID=1229664 RepID=N4TM82_FUSC1|nr:hypothetical protein FOC1_g10013887 [Fusarium oxysporum f. sp. cubense race 1]
MSAAIAMAPSPAPHERFSNPELPAPSTSAATVGTSPSAQRSSLNLSTSHATTQSSTSSSPKAAGQGAKSSPSSASRSAGAPPRIIVKKEPASPSMTHTRPRPRKLDLSKNTPKSNQPTSARPMTARDGLAIQEVGIACLSPGFVTQDPVMKEQLQRSMSVREQQRHIIEARLHQQSAKGDGPDKDPVSQFAAKTPGMSRRNKAPGLSIVAPSHEQFANERVIQSAPLGHSFTGRQHPAPMTRHITNQPSNLSSLSAHPDNAPQPQSLYPSGPSSRGPMTSPGHPPPPQAPTPGRGREYRSAEEAQQELAGGRPELLPKLVHYGGHQPPTPPSPAPGSRPVDASRSASTSRRRTRAEYEDGSPPLGHGPAPTRRGPFGAGRDSPETQRAKKEEFIRLCERAWDLFHS